MDSLHAPTRQVSGGVVAQDMFEDVHIAGLERAHSATGSERRCSKKARDVARAVTSRNLSKFRRYVFNAIRSLLSWRFDRSPNTRDHACTCRGCH